MRPPPPVQPPVERPANRSRKRSTHARCGQRRRSNLERLTAILLEHGRGDRGKRRSVDLLVGLQVPLEAPAVEVLEPTETQSSQMDIFPCNTRG